MPSCFMPADYHGYKVMEIKKETTHISVTLEREIPSGFPNDVKTVAIAINFLNDKSLRIKLTDPTKQRFEIPFPKLNIPKPSATFDPLYEVDVTQAGKRFSLVK